MGRIVGGEIGPEGFGARALFLSKKIQRGLSLGIARAVADGDRVSRPCQRLRELEAEPLRAARDEGDLRAVLRDRHGAAASDPGGTAVAASSMSWFVSAIATTSRPKARTCRSTQTTAAARCKEAGVLPV